MSSMWWIQFWPALNCNNHLIIYKRLHMIRYPYPSGSIQAYWSALRWRHMASQVTANTTVCSTVCSGKRKNNIKFVMKIHWWPVDSPHHDDVIKWKHFPRYWPFVVRWIPRTKASDAELWYCLWSAPEKTKMRLVIWDAIAPIMTSL